MLRRYLDLLAIVACTAALATLTFAEPLSAVLRIGLGLPFVLLFPGYVVIAALFPHRGHLDLTAQAALSLGLSIAIVPLIGLALNYSPWGVRLAPLFACTSLFIGAFALAAAVRRQLAKDDGQPQQPSGRRFRPDGRPSGRWRSMVSPGWLLAIAATLPLLAAGYLATAAGEDGEGFTELYVLGPGGSTSGLEGPLVERERTSLLLGVTNREGGESTYRIDVTVGGVVAGTRGQLTLADGEEWLGEVPIVAERAGDGQKVDIRLYRDGGGEPYRSLHLWVTVAPQGPAYVQGEQGATAVAAAVTRSPTPTPTAVPTVAPAAEAATPTPSPAPAPTPTPTPEPAPSEHIVSPGEYLTLIAELYGIPLSTLLSLNEFPDPDLIYPDQQISLPHPEQDE